MFIFYSFPDIKKIFVNPFFNFNLKKIGKKIHSNMITNFSEIINNLDSEKNLKNNFENFYFEIIKKEQFLGSYQKNDLFSFFLMFFNTIGKDLKIKNEKKNTSEFSDLFSGNIKIKKFCKTCSRKNEEIITFNSLKMKNILKKNKKLLDLDRENYKKFLPNEILEKNSFRSFFQATKVGIIDLFYNFLNDKENKNIKKNNFSSFKKKLEKNFSFLKENELNDEDMFCYTCFEDFEINYEIMNLPELFMINFNKKNRNSSFPIKLTEKIDLSFFKNNNEQNNFFSTQTLNNLDNLESENKDYEYVLKGVFFLNKKKIYLKISEKWFEINSENKKMIEISDFYLKENNQIEFCLYEKKKNENLKINFEKSKEIFFLPRKLIKEFRLKGRISENSLNNDFCMHDKLNIIKREIYQKKKLKRENFEKLEANNINTILMNRSKTSIFYLSKCDKICKNELENLIYMNSVKRNMSVFKNPKKCFTCEKSLKINLVKLILQKVLIFSALNTEAKTNEKKYFISKIWLKEYFSYLLEIKLSSKNSYLKVKNFQKKINHKAPLLWKNPDLQKNLIPIPEKLLSSLLSIYKGYFVYKKNDLSSYEFVEFNKKIGFYTTDEIVIFNFLKNENNFLKLLDKNVFLNILDLEKKIDLFLDLKLKNVFSFYNNFENFSEMKKKCLKFTQYFPNKKSISDFNPCFEILSFISKEKINKLKPYKIKIANFEEENIYKTKNNSEKKMKLLHSYKKSKKEENFKNLNSIAFSDTKDNKPFKKTKKIDFFINSFNFSNLKESLKEEILDNPILDVNLSKLKDSNLSELSQEDNILNFSTSSFSKSNSDDIFKLEKYKKVIFERSEREENFEGDDFFDFDNEIEKIEQENNFEKLNTNKKFQRYYNNSYFAQNHKTSHFANHEAYLFTTENTENSVKSITNSMKDYGIIDEITKNEIKLENAKLVAEKNILKLLKNSGKFYEKVFMLTRRIKKKKNNCMLIIKKNILSEKDCDKKIEKKQKKVEFKENNLIMNEKRKILRGRGINKKRRIRNCTPKKRSNDCYLFVDPTPKEIQLTPCKMNSKLDFKKKCLSAKENYSKRSNAVKLIEKDKNCVRILNPFREIKNLQINK